MDKNIEAVKGTPEPKPDESRLLEQDNLWLAIDKIVQHAITAELVDGKYGSTPYSNEISNLVQQAIQEARAECQQRVDGIYKFLEEQYGFDISELKEEGL